MTATQQMQHAARYVALENTRLRTLLGRHGVQQAEVDAFLRLCDENEASAPAQGLATDTSAMTQSDQNLPTSSTSHGLGNGSTGLQPKNHTAEASRNHLLISKRQPSSPVLGVPDSIAPNCSHRVEVCAAQQPPASQQVSAGQASEIPECPNTSDCFCPPTITPSNQSIDNGLEISCETAASIIIEMRGEGDVNSIRASLGCAGRESCTVRNSTVLQILDES